jgi:hypothetical protein
MSHVEKVTVGDNTTGLSLYNMECMRKEIYMRTGRIPPFQEE